MVLFAGAVSVSADQIAAPLPGSSQSATTKMGPAPQARHGFCTDLVKASCDRGTDLSFDGTGTTQDASLHNDASIASGREYFRTKVTASGPYVTELNSLLAREETQPLVKKLAGVTCDLSDSSCTAETKLKLSGIFEDNFVRSLGFRKVETVSFGCDDPSDCKYTQAQSDAYSDLGRAGHFEKIFDLQDPAAADFYNGRNTEIRTHTKTTVYPKVQEEFKRVLAGMKLPKATLEALNQKIDATLLSTDCVGEGYDPHSFAWSSLDPGRQITLCDGLLTANSSEFAMVFDLAHELSHQIDPCYIHFGDEGFKYTKIPEAKAQDDYIAQNPFAEGIKCLRDPVKSAGLSKTMNFQEDYFLETLDLNAPIAKRKWPFCYADQMQEGFCDAMAAKVLASYFENPANTGGRKFKPEEWRAGLLNVSTHIMQPSVMCKQQERLYRGSTTDEYPTAHERLNIIVMSNTELRRLSGCDSVRTSKSQCL